LGQEDDWLWDGRTSRVLESDGEAEEEEWTIKRAHWRIRVEPIESDADGRRMQVVLSAVKIEAFTNERIRNSSRGFLGSS
jgi:hypothetical protein